MGLNLNPTSCYKAGSGTFLLRFQQPIKNPNQPERLKYYNPGCNPGNAGCREYKNGEFGLDPELNGFYRFKLML